ncbi:hypothetical protein D0868_06223 [Hortaea werneckii]|uniref:Zn(2)-C6 fungal-type domain-containing protein n=1 Tax=Hortaea werneckii TaxID=91943 RepID=A0A3M6YRS3_HORWE|nr:hypothetical protein D0868_06223 [Hortaea werneckii]
MSSIRNRRETPSERACLQCQKRKTKCVPSNDSRKCAFCVKAGKSCTFSAPVSRTPLTRKNLDEAESRCNELEALLENRSRAAASNSAQTDAFEDARLGLESPRARTTTAETTESAPYEWNETTEGVLESSGDGRIRALDGMVSGSSAAGYLGNSSGHSLLHSVSSALPPASESLEPGRPPEGQTLTGTGTDSERAQGAEVAATLNCARFPTIMIQDHFISTYFRCYNTSYPVLHEGTFRERCNAKRTIPASSSWHMIYYMVLAIGEWLSGSCSDDQSLYYEAARSRFRVETLESGNIYTVQACLLMGNYLQKRDRPNTGFNFIGIAHRMALGLGLHRESAKSNELHDLALNSRRAIFWILYTFDSGFSITTGRPILLPDTYIDVRIPSNVDDLFRRPDGRITTEVAYPTTYSTLIALARLARIGNRFYGKLVSVEPCHDVDHQTSVMEQSLSNWRASLPSYFWDSDVPEWFRGPRQVVFWKEANIRILLLLSSQKHQKDNFDKLASGKRYQAVAEETIVDISAFCSQHTDLHLGLSCLGSNTAADRERALYTFEDMCLRSTDCLRNLSKIDKAAVRSLRVLGRLLDKVRHSSGSPRNDTRLCSALHPGTSDPTEALEPRQSHSLIPPGGADAGLPGGFGGINTVPCDNDVQDWSMAADPSFHMFFHGNQDVVDIFQDINGFPGTAESNDIMDFGNLSWYG